MTKLVAAIAAVALLGAGLYALIAVFGDRDDSGVASAPPAGEAVAGGCEAAFGDAWLGRALARGNVVLAYGARADAAPLRALAEDVAGPPDPALEAAGLAVLVVRRTDVDGVVALAWGRRLAGADAADPRLREFAEDRLGRGAPEGDRAC